MISKLDAFNKIRPWEFVGIQRLTFENVYSTNSGLPPCRVELDLLKDSSRCTPRLELRFIDAVVIKLGRWEWMNGIRLKVQLKIEDVSDRQLEQIRYDVFDAESQLVSLQCADFDFHLVE